MNSLDCELEEAAERLIRDQDVRDGQTRQPIGLGRSLAVLALVVVADFCLYGAYGGSGVAVLLAITTAAVTALCPQRAKHAHRGLLLSIALVCLVSVWNHFWLVSLMGWTAVVAYAIKLHNPHWRITEQIVAFALMLLAAPARLLGHLTGFRQWAAAKHAGQGRLRGVPLRVVLIPTAVCLAFVVIFISANPVVARLGSGLGERLWSALVDAGELFSIWRVLFWVLWLVAFTVLTSPAVRNRMLDWLAGLSERLVAPPTSSKASDGNYAAAFWTLVSVNLLFLGYNIMDGIYLYGDATLPEGITWASYTHQGCAWLTGGLALSTAVIGVIFRGVLDFHDRAHRLRRLAYLWAGLNGVLAVGALRRLQLYVDFSGLTFLRIVGVVGTLLVITGLVLMVSKVRARKNFVWLLRVYLVAFWMAGLVLALIPSDYLCARYNVPRIMNGQREVLRPITHKHLSPEALPALIPLLAYRSHDPQNQRLVREGIAALLTDHLESLRRPNSSWSQWQWSAVRARNKLEDVDKALRAIHSPAAGQSAASQRRLYNYADR